MSRWLALLPLVVLVGLGALFAVYGLHRNPQVQPQALVGKPMPQLTLASLDDGTPVSLAAEAGKGPMVVNFFASWCAPCRVEQPVLMKLKADGVRIVGVAYKDVPPRGSPEEAQAFLQQLGDPFARRLVDPDGRAGLEFGVTGVPETYLVGRDGRIIAKHTGPLSEPEARALVARLR